MVAFSRFVSKKGTNEETNEVSNENRIQELGVDDPVQTRVDSTGNVGIVVDE